MSYKIAFTPNAAKTLGSLPKNIQRRIIVKVEALGDDPHPATSKKLVGERDIWRIRVGDYRVIYAIDDGKLMVLVVKVGHRREVYR